MENTIIKLNQLENLLYMIEGAMIEAGADTPEQKRLNDLIYILWDQLKMVIGNAENEFRSTL